MIKNLAAIFIAFATTLASTAQAEPIHDAAVSPLPDLEIGKVKRVSVQKLAPGVQKILQGDIERENQAVDAITGKRKENAYQPVGEEGLYPRNNFHNHVKPINLGKKEHFKSAPSNVTETELASYAYEGFIPEGPTLNGPWSSFTRVYRRPDGILVMLQEWDFVVDGGGIVIVEELMKQHVNKHPASFIKKQTPSGEVFSELTWITKQKQFNLTVWSDVADSADNKYNLAWLYGIAEKIK